MIRARDEPVIKPLNDAAAAAVAATTAAESRRGKPRGKCNDHKAGGCCGARGGTHARGVVSRGESVSGDIECHRTIEISYSKSARTKSANVYARARARGIRHSRWKWIGG